MAGAAERGEVRLWTSKKEQECYENYADLYAIIKTVEKLEKAYVRDAISAKEYEAACLNLIAKFKTLRTALKDNGVPNVEHFMSTYRMECPAAMQRLLHSGIPATIEHGKPRNDGESGVASVAETVQHFITTMDGLKLNLSAVDQLYPYLTDLVAALHKVPQLPPDFEGKAKLKDWMRRMNNMKASDELDEEQVRQLLFDLENSYNSFMRFLGPSSGSQGASSASASSP